MTNFATPKIEELLESGALVKVASLTAEQIAHKIARRANAMFLLDFSFHRLSPIASFNHAGEIKQARKYKPT